jgi:lipoyl(octanoyl) transferase
VQPRILFLGEVDYCHSQQWMRQFTLARDTDTLDEFWILNHPPVYTQGTSCDTRPSAAGDAIPVVKTDRGGQITYHGPGQLIVYLMLDIKRLGMGPKRLVECIETAIIKVLADLNLKATTRKGAPGVYVNDEKIAALGLRIRHGACYHGLSLNVDMDLSPFEYIDPCGYAGLKVTGLSAQGVIITQAQLADQLIERLTESIYCFT